MFKKLSFALFLLLSFAFTAAAQDVEVDRYTINARVDPATNAIEVKATLAISNLSQSPKPKLFFRLTRQAKNVTATASGTAATVDVTDDRRVTTLSQIAVTPAASLGGGAKTTVDFNYRIEAPESNALIAISPGEVLLAPDSIWVPMLSTGFSLTGATTAPFSLTVTTPNLRAASAGTFRGDANNQTFENALNSLPFFLASSFDTPITAEQSGVKLEIYAPTGLQSVDGKAVTKESLQRWFTEAGRIIDFMTKTLGAPPADTSLRIISSARSGTIAVPGALVVSEQTLRRDNLSANTIEALADAIARIWIDGRVRVRGQEARSAQADRAAQAPLSFAPLRDSLPRYLTALYIENQYGKEAGSESFNRMRWAYTPVLQARRDAELDIQTLLIPTYTAAAFGKGPLVFRLLAETIGRDKFIAALRSVFTGDKTKIVNLDSLRQAIRAAAGENAAQADKLFQQWIDTIIEPDIVIGVAQPTENANVQRVNIRNLGTGDVTVKIAAVTASNKLLVASVLVPSENITSFDLQTSEKITSIEADPDKLIPQSNYDNDAKPPQVWGQTAFNEGVVAFNKNDYATAETKFRSATRTNSQNATLHAWLARSLAAQNKMDEAAREANAALAITPTPASALAWAHVTLGQIALARNQASEATSNFRRALIEAEEVPAQYAAREGAVKAQVATNATPQVEEGVRSLVTQLDSLIKQPTSDKLYTIVVKNNLKKFVQGLTVTPPTAWATEIARVDQMDANRVSLDVRLKITAGGREQTGTAVFILHRTAQGWMLEDVQLFNVK